MNLGPGIFISGFLIHIENLYSFDVADGGEGKIVSFLERLR